MLQTGSSLI